MVLGQGPHSQQSIYILECAYLECCNCDHCIRSTAIRQCLRIQFSHGELLETPVRRITGKFREPKQRSFSTMANYWRGHIIRALTVGAAVVFHHVIMHVCIQAPISTASFKLGPTALIVQYSNKIYCVTKVRETRSSLSTSS